MNAFLYVCGLIFWLPNQGQTKLARETAQCESIVWQASNSGPQLQSQRNTHPPGFALIGASARRYKHTVQSLGVWQHQDTTCSRKAMLRLGSGPLVHAATTGFTVTWARMASGKRKCKATTHRRHWADPSLVSRCLFIHEQLPIYL
jgi:hypothetical protein